jgi:hypothetical protein
MPSGAGQKASFHNLRHALTLDKLAVPGVDVRQQGI